jgi:hypothetical protein
VLDDAIRLVIKTIPRYGSGRKYEANVKTVSNPVVAPAIGRMPIKVPYSVPRTHQIIYSMIKTL